MPAPRPKHVTGRLATLLMMAVLLLSATTARAEPLEAFEATFRITVSKIPTPVKATLSLEPLEAYPGHYRMKLVIDSWLLKNREESVFAWRDCQPRTDHYIHEFKGFGRHRWHHMQFHRHPPRVVNKSDEEKVEYAIEEDTLDDLTMLLTAGCALAEGQKSYQAQSAYGDDLRDNHFQVVDREQISTPAGDVDTLVVQKKRDKDSERRTLFWVAPGMNYMVVRAKHIENPALFGELVMIDYEGPGETATERETALRSGEE